MPHALRLSDLISKGKLAGKHVFICTSLSVPQDGADNITENTRIRASVPAVKAALDASAAVMVTSHLDHPTEDEFRPEDPLVSVAKRLSKLLDCDVKLVQDWVDGMDVAPDQVVLLGNCRMSKGERENSDELTQKMARLCNVYVNDAFGAAYRTEAITHGITKFTPITYVGPLLVAELDALGKTLGQPAHPLVTIVAGLKVPTKLTILKPPADKVDNLVIDDGIANTFILAVGLKINKSLAEADLVGGAKAIVEMLAVRGASVSIPVDVVCAKEFSAAAAATVKDATDVAGGGMTLDIGPRTTAQLAEQLKSADTIVWNGSVGVFEFDQFGSGIKVLAEAVATSSGFSIAGDGDTLAAVARYNITDKVGYTSTGGGAFLEFLEGRTLPVVEILEQHTQNQAAVA